MFIVAFCFLSLISTLFLFSQEHLFILFYKDPAKLYFWTNFDEKFQTEPQCGASLGTAEGVGQQGHDSKNFLADISILFQLCVGGEQVTPTK